MNKTVTNRRNWLSSLGLALAGVGLSGFKTSPILAAESYIKTPDLNSAHAVKKEGNMKLGAFSVSLNVKDIQASKQFYENLGFSVFHGNIEQNWLIMKNDHAIVGLFQGMFERNTLTFNPGWDENATNIEHFDDIREIQNRLKEKGMKLQTEADETTSGPASFIVLDPDGNPILIDQHV